MDSTISTYKVKPVMKILYESVCITLINIMDYPNLLLPGPDEDEDEIYSRFFKGFIDLVNFLKIYIFSEEF